MSLPPSNYVATHEQAVPHARSPGIDDIPVELVLQSLANLGQKDLRAFSQSSTSSYKLALASGLYIRRNVRWTRARGFGTSLSTLNRVLDHARDVRPALNVGVVAEVSRLLPEEGPISEGTVQLLLDAISCAFPYLARLDLSLPLSAPSAAVDAWLGAHAAPKLRSFSLRLAAGGIPNNLFNGAAPALRTVSLSVADNGFLATRAPLAAFRNVTRLLLSLDSPVPDLDLAAQFPALVVLGIQCSGAPQPINVDLAGLQLHGLIWQGNNLVLGDTSAIPIVESKSDRIASSWPAGCDEINARADCCQGHCQTSITFGPPDGSWKRTVTLETLDPDAALPLADAPQLSCTLVSLTLAKNLVNALVQTPAELRALRELQLDLTTTPDDAGWAYCWPPAFPRELGLRADFADVAPRVRCPALARIGVFTAPGGRAAAVRPNKLTRLAHALGLRDRQAALVLAGCVFFSEPHWPLFDRVFARVDVVGSTIPEYYRACWYNGVFDRSDWFRDV